MIEEKKYKSIPKQLTTRLNSELKVLRAFHNIKAQDLSDATQNSTSHIN